MQHNFLVVFDARNNSRTRGVRTCDRRAVAYIIYYIANVLRGKTYTRTYITTDIKLYWPQKVGRILHAHYKERTANRAHSGS